MFIYIYFKFGFRFLCNLFIIINKFLNIVLLNLNISVCFYLLIIFILNILLIDLCDIINLYYSFVLVLFFLKFILKFDV